MATNKNPDDVNSVMINMNSESSNNSNLNEDEENEDDDIIDLDMEAELHLENHEIEENKKEEGQPITTPVMTQNFASTVQNTEQLKKPMKKGEFFSPKNTSSIGKLFLNTTSNVITEENANEQGNIKIEQTNKTVISKVVYF
jgi:hypothetical protein